MLPWFSIRFSPDRLIRGREEKKRGSKSFVARSFDFGETRLATQTKTGRDLATAAEWLDATGNLGAGKIVQVDSAGWKSSRANKDGKRNRRLYNDGE